MKYNTRLTHFVEYDDLEEAILERFPNKNFEVLADLEARNDSSQTYLLKKQVLSKYEQQRLDRYLLTGVGSFMTRVLMQVMVNEDLIPEGTWVIKISW